ncbi:MAG TPA: hypothetical protein VGL56_13605 [Fimbriimonadaceae bacterium]
MKSRIADVAKLLSNRPELVEDIHLGQESEDAAIQAMFTPKRMARIKAAQASIEAGKGMTKEQVEASLAANKVEWLAENPR